MAALCGTPGTHPPLQDAGDGGGVLTGVYFLAGQESDSEAEDWIGAGMVAVVCTAADQCNYQRSFQLVSNRPEPFMHERMRAYCATSRPAS
jgi:hypothetical protein